MLPNSPRNLQLVRKRIEDPAKWSYNALAEHYKINTKTAYDIFEANVARYASPQEIRRYRKACASLRRGGWHVSKKVIHT